jgi:5-(carboxyamino)imidazole ribonucleotide synthase
MMRKGSSAVATKRSTRSNVLLPGQTLGVLGSGQLGRMFVQAAQRMGYRVHVFSPDAESPAGQLADREIVAPFDDTKAVAEFAKGVAVVTLEFENVPLVALEAAAKCVPVRPNARPLATAQNRLVEKQFFSEIDVPCAPFYAIEKPGHLSAAIDAIGFPAVLKTAENGYDGKGQTLVRNQKEATKAWDQCGRVPCILEGWVEYRREMSVIVARGGDGSMVSYGPIVNTHVNHILDVSILPAPRLDDDERVMPTAAARQFAEHVATQLKLVGVLCVEFFETEDGQLLANEIAPRPHNSGHLTINACATSQFEQQVRAICGLPLGSPETLTPAAMANLLGDLWAGGEPRWNRALDFPEVHLHLYGKQVPRPGRKMGHLTALADSPAEAERIVREARAALVRE